MAAERAGGGGSARGDDGGESSGLQWSLSQCFGEKDPSEEYSPADILSTVSFDGTGRFLATGDKGGRIVVFEEAPGSEEGAAHYRFYAEFQSHEPGFDYLKSLDIEERINEIAWWPGSGGALFLLSTNDKTIKLWKIKETMVRGVTEKLVEDGGYGEGVLSVERLRMPKLGEARRELRITPRRVFANGHAYHVNSLSANSDGEHFLTADDLRVNLWNVEHAKTSFNIVDMKPESMEDLTEVITCARFHPRHCHELALSTSRGAVRLIDMRASALCDGHAKLFLAEGQDSSRSYFSEIIASVSDVRFAANGHEIFARDYLSVHVWDVRSERGPLLSVPVHEHLRPRLTEVYESDAIFDKFEIAASSSGRRILTGTYGESLRVFDRDAKDETSLRVARDAAHRPKTRPLPILGKPQTKDPLAPTYDTQPDTGGKILHYAWHPNKDAIAVAGLTNLFVFNGAPKK